MTDGSMRDASLASRLEALARDIPGWTPVDQLLALFLLALSTRDLKGEILEVGSWCGRASCAFGLAAAQIGGTHVHCIDPFPARDDWYRNPDGSYSFRVSLEGETITAYDQQSVWEEPFVRDIAPVYERFPRLIDAFRHSIASQGLESLVSPHRGSLASFLNAAPGGLRCKLAFIDGDHGYEAVKKDISLVERCLVPGGWLCFDDAFTTSTGVDRAIVERIVESSGYDVKLQVTRKMFVARRTPSMGGEPSGPDR